MSGIFDLADSFEFVIDGFYNRSFSEQVFILEFHQHILHIVPDA